MSQDLLLLCLRDDQDIWDALSTPGVREALRPGSIVVNHGPHCQRISGMRTRMAR